MSHDRQAVLRAALKLLDEVGLDGLSLRKLAAALDIQAASLYWHFSNKQELLDHMVAVLFEDLDLPDRPARGQGWDEWLMEHCTARRRAMLAHRDGARLVLGGRPPADRVPAVNGMLGAMVEAGFSARDALQGLIAVGNYTTGYVLEEQAVAGREDGAVPDLEVVWKAIEEGFGADPDGDFEYSLRIILDGLRARRRPPR